MEETYTQCLLVYDQWGEPYRWQVAWIPTQFAIKGKVLKIKNWGEWVDNWTVDEVYNTSPAKKVKEHERDYLEFRLE